MSTHIQTCIPDGIASLIIANSYSYHCLYCHGYEDSDCASAGIIAAFGLTSDAQPAAYVAHLAAQFAGKVVVYTNGSEELAQQVQELVKNNPKITTDTRPIEALIKESDADGEPGIKLGASDSAPAETVSHRFFVHAPDALANVSFAKSLGLELSPNGAEIKTTAPFNATNVPGCYAVGDVGSPLKAVSQAMALGSVAAAGVTTNLF